MGMSFHQGHWQLQEQSPFGSKSGYCHLPNEGPFLLAIAPYSANNIPQFYDDLEGFGYVFGVEKWVLLVGIAGYEEFCVGMVL